MLEAAAPRVGDDAVRSRPYAGKPENPPLLVFHDQTVTASSYRQVMERSDNVRGAENQQERLWNNGWIVGFVDGEGCFSCPVFRNHKAKLGWQVQPTFVVVQSESSREVLEDFVNAFGCGKVYINRRYDNHREDLYRFYVSRFAELREIIVPFFRKNPLRTTKRDNFEKFAEIIELMDSRSHLTIGGMTKIAEIVETMNHRKPSEFLRILRDHTPTVSS